MATKTSTKRLTTASQSEAQLAATVPPNEHIGQEEPSQEPGTRPQSDFEAAPNAGTGSPSGEPATPPSTSPRDGFPQDQSAQTRNEGKSDEKDNFLTAASIVKSAKDAGTEFFQDQHGYVFAWTPTMGEDKHHECLRIRSKPFKARLLDLIQHKSNVAASPRVIPEAIETLELQAYSSERKELANRRSFRDGKVFIDLSDPAWRMITVSEDGWKIEQQGEPLFYRTQHQQQLPDPVPGGDPNELFKYVPVDTEQEKTLVMTWAIGAFYPVVPNPILLFVGQQGSAKTTRSRRLRSLLDPSVTPVLGDIEMADLFLTFQHHAVPCFENVSRFTRREADMFCRAVTGNGVERRKLYTDSDQVLYSFRRPIIINGLDTPTTRPDFLDRCLIINCHRMERFVTLLELDKEFEAARPRLLGAMLDLLARTLGHLKATPGANEFRMADFARFGRAVTLGLGKDPKEFDDAYRMNIHEQDFEILEDSPMSRLLKRFAGNCTEKNSWTGTAERLLDGLKKTAEDTKDLDAMKDLPRSPRWLSSRLGELAPALATQGLIVRKLPRTNASREWEIYAPSTKATEHATEQVREQMKGGETHE